MYVSVASYQSDAPSPHAYASPEGHGIEFDENGNVIQMTLVNLRFLVERDRELRITWPDGRVTHDAAPQVLAAAA